MKKLLLLLLLLFPSLAEAKTVWVRLSGGSTAANCTAATGNTDPGSYIRSMRTVWSSCTIVAGDTINVWGGQTYAEAVIDSALDSVPAGGSGFSSLPIGISGWGVIGSPVTIQSVNGTATFTGTANTCQRFNDLTAAHYWVFKNMIWDGCDGGGNAAPSIYHHIKYENIEIKNLTTGFGKAGCIDYYGGFIWVSGSRVHDCFNIATPQTSQQQHGLYIEGPDAVIENNEIYNIKNGFGVHLYTQNSPTDRAVIRNNYIHDVGIGNTTGSVSCAILARGVDIKFYNNICAHSQQGMATYFFGTPDRVQIVQNTFYDLGFSGAGCGSECDVLYLEASTNARVQNNIIYDTTGMRGNFYTVSATNLTLSDNFCPSPGTGCTQSGNPLFVNPGAGDFHLQLGSQAINAGATLGSPYNVDFDSVIRSVLYDLGAFEFASSPATVKLPSSPTGLRLGSLTSLKIGQTP